MSEARVLDPYKVSPSRVNALLSCGTAFKLKYVDGLPEETSGSAALFGTVVHLALEWWATDREQSLLELMEKAWLETTDGTAAGGFLGEYQKLSRESVRTKHEIIQARLARGWETKAVTMTKDWKESPTKKKIDALLVEWLPRLDADPKTIWRFTERDPLPNLYDESLPLARRYEERYRHLPPVLYTEFKATPTWKGFEFDCRIDTIEVVLERETGEMFLGVTDYKTYRHEPPPYKDWRQAVMYDRGLTSLIESGVITLPPEVADLPMRVGFDYVRLGKRDYFQPFGQADFDRLERELQHYAAIVSGGLFLPAEKGRNPDFCPFPSQCCLGSCVAAGGESRPEEVTV